VFSDLRKLIGMPLAFQQCAHISPPVSSFCHHSHPDLRLRSSRILLTPGSWSAHSRALLPADRLTRRRASDRGQFSADRRCTRRASRYRERDRSHERQPRHSFRGGRDWL